MPVGFRQGRFEDTTRPNWDGSGPRPLSWAAWYPASNEASERVFASPATEPWFSIGPAARDAPISPGRRCYPVVLLSHGTGGTVMHLEWLARDLAERGFIAIGVDHHGNTTTEPYRAEGFLCWWERARDLTLLHALGMPPRQVARMLALEQAMTAVATSAVGVLFGVALSKVIVPADTLTAQATRPVPPLVVQVPWLAAAGIAVVMAAVPTLAIMFTAPRADRGCRSSSTPPS